MVAFHPIIQKWFTERYGEPTDIQALSWPRIAQGQHLLITAPTGSGKTLTALLWALNRFATGDLVTGKTRILYISPLKALNNDIRKNLIDPLTELRSLFDAADPISPSGLGLGIHGDKLPRRIASNYLVLHGDQLVLSIAKRGKELNFYVEHDASDIDRYLDVLHHLTYRSFRPIRRLRIETINSEAAVSSPYLACIEDRFNIIRDYKAVVIQRAFQ